MISQPSWQVRQKNVGAFFERWKNARGETADSERLVRDFLAVLGKDIADVSHDMVERLLELLKAHQTLDRAVMKLYGFRKDVTEVDIVAALMERYRQ